MQKIKSYHLFAYLTLLSLLGIGLWLFSIFSGLPDRQFLVVIVTAIVYFCWGIAYHLLEGDLHPKIVVEYLLIAILSIFLLRGAVYR